MSQKRILVRTELIVERPTIWVPFVNHMSPAVNPPADIPIEPPGSNLHIVLCHDNTSHKK